MVMAGSGDGVKPANSKTTTSNPRRKKASLPAPKATLKPVRLDDKYDLAKDQIFITGTQAVVRLVLMQKEELQ